MNSNPEPTAPGAIRTESRRKPSGTIAKRACDQCKFRKIKVPIPSPPRPAWIALSVYRWICLLCSILFRPPMAAPGVFPEANPFRSCSAACRSHVRPAFLWDSTVLSSSHRRSAVQPASKSPDPFGLFCSGLRMHCAVACRKSDSNRRISRSRRARRLRTVPVLIPMLHFTINQSFRPRRRARPGCLLLRSMKAPLIGRYREATRLSRWTSRRTRRCPCRLAGAQTARQLIPIATAGSVGAIEMT